MASRAYPAAIKECKYVQGCLMFRRLLLTLLLTSSLAAMAQYVTVGPTGAPQIVYPGVATPTGGALLSTPVATFASPQTTVGISTADRAGISMSPPINPAAVAAAPSPTAVVYGSQAPAATEAAPAAAQGQEGAPAETGGRAINDMGPSSFAGAATVGAAPQQPVASLGEVAARYKARQSQNVRTYTNADAQRLSGGVNAPQAATTQPPPAAPPQQPAMTPQVSSGGRPSPATGLVQGAPPQGAESEAATTPQVNQPQARPGSKEEEGQRLPATSSFLPLLGMLGLATGGIGLWLKKFRR